MKNHNFKSYIDEIIASRKGHPFAKELLMESEKGIDVYFSPFESINRDAKICIVGISPGPTQADVANASARDSLKNGESLDCAADKAKVVASFSGALRSNLIKLLDYTGISRFLGLSSAEMLFCSHANLLHCTSVFRYPTLVDGRAIPSAKKFFKSSLLREMVDTCLVDEFQQLSNDVLYIPLGGGVAEVLIHLADRGVIKHHQILSHLPHPSSLNGERIAYFLGKKKAHSLTPKTNAKKIDSAKERLFGQLNLLGVNTPDKSALKAQVTNTKQNKLVAASTQHNQQPSLKSSTLDIPVSMVSDDGFMLESVEQKISIALKELSLRKVPKKSGRSKELAVTKDEKVVAYISRSTALNDGYMVVSVHPRLQEKIDSLVDGMNDVIPHQRGSSRFISSSNYRGFNSKGYSSTLQSNEHQAVAFKVDVTKGLGSLKSLLSSL